VFRDGRTDKTVLLTPKCNMALKSWAMELKEELHSIGLAFVWKNQQECNWKEMLRLEKERCNDIDIDNDNDIERQNMLAKFLGAKSYT
jgi:hypothetical protein